MKLNPPRRLTVLAAVAALSLTGTAFAGGHHHKHAKFAAAGTDEAAGAVYVASNAASGNEILIYSRSGQGNLTPDGSVATGGNGTGAGLGNQGGLVLSDNERYLYVVNAGSNSISALEVSPFGLNLIGTYPSGGMVPVSIALDRDLLYVVNAGGGAGDEDNVSGFTINRGDGSLAPISGSTRPLSAVSTGPAEAAFTKDGHFVIVTEKATNTIDVFPVMPDGTLDSAISQASVGMTPFGFDVDKRGRVFVSEAFGGGADASAVTSYDLDDFGTLTAIDPSVPTTETAACWFLIGPDGRYGYTTNTGSGTITGYKIKPNGRLIRIDDDGVTGVSMGGPIDLDFNGSGQYLYTLNASASTISAFRVNRGHGSLNEIEVITGLPAGANGLAAR